MTIKTFQSITNPDTTFRVRGLGDSGVELFHRNGGITIDSLLAPSDAPALALAILEAAGYGEEVVTDGSPDGHIQVAKYYLYEGVKAHASIAAEARERAELEAEALKFYFAFHSAVDRPCQAWNYLDQQDKQQWLAVARRAREMRAEK